MSFIDEMKNTLKAKDGADVGKIVDKVYEGAKDSVKPLKKFNLMVAGKTGVGKSTLLNAYFGEDLAETGIGLPVTQEIHRYSSKEPGKKYSIYDVPGFELSGSNGISETTEKIINVIKTAKGNEEDEVHCIWYCVNGAGSRFEEAELNGIVNIMACCMVPAVIVLTQAKSVSEAEKLSAEIQKNETYIEITKKVKLPIIPVLAKDYEIDDYKVTKYGLNELVEATESVIEDDELKTAHIALQNVNIKKKLAAARKMITAAAAAAFLTGYTPLPFADAPLLIAEQVAMMLGVAKLFNISISKKLVTTFASAALGSGGATILGKTIVSGLLKLIPGTGTWIGGTISGATAAALTTALGEAFLYVISKVSSGELSEDWLWSEEGKKHIIEILKKRLSKNRKKDGKLISEDDDIRF